MPPVETALYDLLGVHPEASEGQCNHATARVSSTDEDAALADEIKKAYRKKVRDKLSCPAFDAE